MIRRLLVLALLLLLLLLAAPAWAAIAYDTITNPTPGTGNLSWTHAGSASATGALVFVTQYGTNADQVSGVTYGGTSMSEVTGSPVCDSTEPACVHGFYLVTSLPAGSQTVAVTVSGADSKSAVAITVTANGDTALVNQVATNADNSTGPSSSLALSSTTSFVALGWMSGNLAVTTVSPLGSWTSSYEFDHGSGTGGAYKYDVIASTDVTCGWTQNTDDAMMICVALKQAVPDSASRRVIVVN